MSDKRRLRPRYLKRLVEADEAELLRGAHEFTGTGDPNGVVVGYFGNRYTDKSTGFLWLKQADGGTSGWVSVSSTNGAPVDAPFVTVGNTGDLDEERALTAGDGIVIADQGANTTVTVAAAPHDELPKSATYTLDAEDFDQVVVFTVGVAGVEAILPDVGATLGRRYTIRNSWDSTEDITLVCDDPSSSIDSHPSITLAPGRTVTVATKDGAVGGITTWTPVSDFDDPGESVVADPSVGSMYVDVGANVDTTVVWEGNNLADSGNVTTSFAAGTIIVDEDGKYRVSCDLSGYITIDANTPSNSFYMRMELNGVEVPGTARFIGSFAESQSPATARFVYDVDVALDLEATDVLRIRRNTVSGATWTYQDGTFVATEARAVSSGGGGGSGVAPTLEIRTAAGPYTVADSVWRIVVVRQTVAAPIQVNCSLTPSAGDILEIIDGKRDASTNNITVNGNVNNINGAASFVMNTDGQAERLVFDGTEWLRT